MIKWILPKELAIVSAIYSFTFLKTINGDELFYAPEYSQQDLL